MGNFIGLAHIGVQTEDIEASKAFYIDNLGFKLDHETCVDKPGGAWLKIAFISLGGMIIELLEPSNKASVKKGNGGCVDHLTIEVKDLDKVISDLKAKGIKFETEEPVRTGLFNGARLIFFRGPGGERLELFEFLA